MLHLSPTSQNQIINLIGHKIIPAILIAGFRKARFSTVLVDEVSSHNVEYLPLCLRFVDKKYDIRKEFFFIKLARIRATDIANAIVC